MQRNKSLLLATLFTGLLIGLTGCAAVGESGGTTAAPEVSKSEPAPVLTGTWKQANSKSTDSYQEAVISADSIEVDWVTDGGATRSIYWVGSFVPPMAPGTYTWTSQNDTEKTATALLASSDPTKEFTFDNGIISYKVTALGTTMTVELKAVK